MPNWKKLIVSGSDALLNSLTVSTTGRFDDDLTISGSNSSLILKGDGNKSARLTHVGGGLVIDGSVQNQYISIGSDTWNWPGGVKVYGDLQLTGSDGGTATFEGNAQSTVNLKTTTNSKNNYIVGTTAGAISFRPDGTESVFLKSDGNVGIGTSIPGEKLDVNGSVQANNFKVAEKIIHKNDAHTFIHFTSDTITFDTGGSTVLTLDSSQNVNATGIISGSDVYINDWNSVSASLATLTQNQIDGSGTADYVARFSDANTLTTGLIQDDGSSVGIATGPGAKKLTVGGNAQISGELFFTHFDQTSTNASRFRDDTILRFGTNRIFGIKYNSTADQLQFVSSSNTIVSIDGDGNTGIEGDLTVNGTITLSESSNEIIKSNGSIRLNIDSNNDQTDRVFIVSTGANSEVFKVSETGYTTAQSTIKSQVGILALGDDVTLFRDGANILRTDDTLHANNSLHIGGDGKIYDRANTSNFIELADTVNISTDTSVTGDLTVTGNITAQEFHTEFVSASIIYESGSTKFGDTLDDDHDFTGSINLLAQSGASGLDIRRGTNIYMNLNNSSTRNEINFKSTQGLRFYHGTDSSSPLFISSSGNVGIGTSSPGGALHVYNGGSERLLVDGDVKVAGATDLKITGTSRRLSFDAGTGTVRTSTANSLLLQTNNTTALAINSSQAVQLNSYGSGTHTGTLAKSLGVDSSGNIIEFTGGSGGGTVSSITNGADNRIATFTGADSLNGEANLTFDGDIFAVNTNELYVSASRVGIGTNVPSASLQISTTMTSSPTSNIFLDVDGSNVTGGGGAIIFGTSATAGTTTSYNAKITGTRVTGGSGGDSQLGFWTTLVSDTQNPQERMTITKEGRVGIGTTSPAVTLHVDGFTRINGGLQLNQNGAAQVYQIQNNALRFGTNNTERMRILADGKVGIGTTNPIYPFHVVGSAYVNSGTLFIDSGQRLKWGNSNQFIEGTNDTSLEFGTGGSTKMYLDNSGNLGIGTTSPGAKLDVNGDVYINSNYPSNVAANDLTIGKTTTGDHGLTIVTSNSNTAGIFFADNDNNDAGRIKYQHSNNSMRFETNRSEAMRIDSSGNVGIGTTSPASKLEVQTGYIISSGSGAADLGFVLDRAGLDTYHIRHLDGGLTIYNNTDNRKEMTFDGTGKVGIGTSTPATTLDVNGEIQNNGIFRRGGNVIIKSTGSETMFGPGGSGIITFHNSATMTTGDETIRIDADGNLLLNNTSAAARLDIREDTNYAIRAEDASGHYFRVNTGGDVDMRGDLVVQGTITAQEFHTEFVSASIIYDSGSTKFGDTLDDNHDFTGSVNVSGSMVLTDNTKLQLGSNSTAGDLRIFHTGTVSKIANNTGDLEITQFVDDGDIKFLSDDGSGGTTEYFRVDGGSEVVLFNKGIRLVDNQRLDVGGATDGRFYHDGTDTQLVTITGDLIIKNSNDDGDIQFRSDDGSGGTAEYFRVDGGATKTIVSKAFQFFDSVNLEFGDSSDLQIFHNSADTWFDNYTGNINFRNRQDDGDIIFHSDDGSGGIAQYLRVDGGIHETVFSKSTRHMDSVYAKFGSGEDLKIYHDGSNSYINEVGVGSLIIQASDLFLRAGGTNNTNNALRAVNGGTVTLFHANSAKLDTTSAGITVTGDIDADDITIDDWGSVSASLSAIQTAGGVNGTGASNKVAVWSDSDTLTSDTNLHWDSSNDRLGIGATSPAFKTTIYSDSSTDSFPLVVGQPNAANEFVGIGLSGFVASNGAVKAGLVLDRKSTYGVGDIHILNNSTTDNSNATLADSKLTILQNGNVGIGTTDPGTDNLRVSGTGRVARILATNDSVPLVVQNTSGATARIGFKGTTSTSDYHVSVGANGQNYTVYTDNAERMRITSTGNVGIGTTSPATTLDVYGTSDTYLTVRNSGGGNKAGIRMYGGSAGISHIWHDDTETNPPGIHFGTSADTATTPTTQLYIKGSNGNVGIGTSSPGKTLHVAGEISGSAIQVIGGSSTNKFYSTNTGAIAEFKPSDTRSGMQPIFLYRSTVTGTANYMLASGGTTLFGLYDSGVPSDLSGMVRITPNNSSEAPAVRIGDAGSNGAYLDIGGNIKLLNNGNSYINGGNVGIGTSSPGTKLHVSDGTFKVQSTSSNNRGVKITPNGEIEQVSSAADWLHLQRNHNGKVAIGADSTADLHVYNDLLIDTAKISYQENTDVDSAAAETIATVTHASYDAAFFDYVVKNGTNLRAGTVMAVHDGTNVEFTDNSTKDIGTTSGVTFSVDISGTDLRLRATTTTDNWTIKTLVRTL